MVFKNFMLSMMAVASLSLVSFSGVSAQDALPSLPDPIQTLVDQGAQIRYLGNEHGMDAWITIKNGQEQYFYVKPDGSAFVMGLMFDKTGELVTIDQVSRLRGEDGNEILDALASDVSSATKAESVAFKSPSERLFHDIENSNWVPMGAAAAPALYAFIDPQCPHCHSFIEDLRKKNILENGRAQLRVIPVGFKEETRAQAAFLLATPNPMEKWYRHMDGDESALPAKSEINQQGVQRNISILQNWELSVTPIILYRALDGSVKIVRGRPKDVDALVADLKK